MAAKKRNELPPSVGCPLIVALLALCGYLIWTLLSTIAADWRSAKSPTHSSTEGLGGVPKEKAMATLINLNGELCAKVLLVAPTTDPEEYAVTCQEYGDARKSGTKKNMVVYMVNMNRGIARVYGRA